MYLDLHGKSSNAERKRKLISFRLYSVNNEEGIKRRRKGDRAREEAVHEQNHNR